MTERAGYIYKELTLSCDTAQYSDGDVLAAPQELAGVCPAGHPVKLVSLSVTDKDDQGAALAVVLLRTNVSLGTENAAAGITDAVADEILSMVEIGTANYTDLGSSQVVWKTADAGDAGMGAICLSGAGDSLYVGAIARGTATYTASGITLKFGFENLRV